MIRHRAIDLKEFDAALIVNTLIGLFLVMFKRIINGVFKIFGLLDNLMNAL